MIVEDSETQRVILSHIMETEGWRVQCFKSAEDTLSYLSGAESLDLPDLIIVDFHLPGIHGDELCRRLKMNFYTRSIPIMFLTVDTGEDTERHALESGADDYLPKYTEDEILLIRIRSLLRESGKRHFFYSIGSPLFQHSRILAVDEDKNYLDFLETAFKEDNINLDRSSQSLEAIKMISERPYDCIILGQFSSNEWVDISRKILAMKRNLEENVLLLVLMTNETREEMSNALEAGADDFASKSSDISIIKARLISLLRRKFIQEENQRIFLELKQKEIEVERSRIEKSSAEAKVVLAEKLLGTVELLEEEIEERKRMERKIKNYSKELERSNKELEAFAYVASHDLQEPLRAIASYLQLVEKRYKDKIDEKGKDFIARAVGGAQRMQEMINDLLIYSRITTRGRSFETCSINAIVERTLANLSVAIDRSKAQITSDPMPELVCDEAQILRLFQNLISNAIKFCDQVPEIRVSAEEQKNEWLFSIRDNGIGIESDQRENIFKIFHRLHSRGKFPGTGIGLAICQKIVDRHYGKIWVESEPGKGSVFYFTIHKMNQSNEGDDE